MFFDERLRIAQEKRKAAEKEAAVVIARGEKFRSEIEPIIIPILSKLAETFIKNEHQRKAKIELRKSYSGFYFKAKLNLGFDAIIEVYVEEQPERNEYSIVISRKGMSQTGGKVNVVVERSLDSKDIYIAKDDKDSIRACIEEALIDLLSL